MSPVPPHWLEYLAFGAFWSFVVALDLVCLWNLRRSRVDATARVLWVVWIVLAPILGAISCFIVRPTADETEAKGIDLPFNETGTPHRHWNERIQR